MSFEKRQSTLDLAREYFGVFGSYFIAALLLISTFVWFLIQTTTASNALTHLISIHESPNIDQFVQVSVILGLASTLLCMEGIALLKKLSFVAFPILFVTFIVILFSAPKSFPQNASHTLSLSGLTLVLATNLGITADMPTFFRHSHSWSDSIKALSATQLMSMTLGLASLYLGSIISGAFEIDHFILMQNQYETLRYSLILFLFLSTVSANVANVYSASVGWEVIAPKALIGRQEYLILGLSLTMLYILLGNVFSLDHLLSASDNALVNLSLCLILAYVLKHSFKKIALFQLQIPLFLAWLVSSLFNTIQTYYNPIPFLSPLTISLFLIILILGLSLTIIPLKNKI